MTRSRIDALHVTLSLAILFYVWRLQDIFLVLRQLHLFTIISIACVVLFFLDRDPRRKLGRVRQPIIRLATAIVVLIGLSVLTSIRQRVSFEFLVFDHLKTFLLMIFLAVSVRDFSDVERFAWVHVFGATATSIYSLTSSRLAESGRLEVMGYYDENDLSMFLVCTLPFVIYFLVTRKQPSVRGMAAVAMVLSMSAIVAMGSRGGFVALVAVMAYLLLGFKTLSRGMRWTVGIAAVALLSLFATKQFWERMETILHPTQDYNWVGESDTGRLEVWSRGLGYMINRPLLGVGAQAFGAAEGNLSEFAKERELIGLGVRWSAAHNSFIQIGAELGIFGLITFIALINVAVRTSWRIGRSPFPYNGRTDVRVRAMGQAIVGAILGYCVAGFFLSQAYSKFLYVVLGTAAGLSAVTQSAISNESSARVLRAGTRRRHGTTARRQRAQGTGP